MTREPPPRRADFVHFEPVQTRWGDNDVYGHVNNVVYYAYFDSVINRYLVEEGGLDLHGGDTIGLVVSSQCRFLAAAAYPETLDGALAVVHVGRTSVRYAVALFRGDVPIAAGEVTHVFVGRAGRRPAPLPERLRAALLALRPLG